MNRAPRVVVIWAEDREPVEYTLRERDGELWATLDVPGPLSDESKRVAWVAPISEAIEYTLVGRGRDG